MFFYGLNRRRSLLEVDDSLYAAAFVERSVKFIDVLVGGLIRLKRFDDNV